MKNIKSLVFINALLLATATSYGQSLYWDTNGATVGAATAGNADGVWDADTTTHWTSDVTGASVTSIYVPGSDVVFSAGSDVSTANVTVSGTQIVNSITFKEGNVVLSGSNIDDASTRVLLTVNNGVSATMNNTASFNADIVNNGTFTVTSLGSGDYVNVSGTGTTTIHRLDARVVVNGGTVISTASGGNKVKQTVINSGGTFRIEGNSYVNGKTSMTINNGGTLELATGMSQTFSYFQGGGSVVGESGSEVKIGGDNKSTTFDGSFSGDLDIFSIGTGSLTLGETSSTEFIIGNNGENNSILGDGIHDTATNLNGSFHFDLTGADLSAGNSWSIVDVAALDESFGGTFNVIDFTNDSGTWTNNSNSDLIFSQTSGVLTVIPEPSTLSLILSFAGLAFLSLRKRR
ncbi:PEP-CTERM sorting domain-containing protein [Kiritimatiellota bacterium B12222]|nr:PEP-CTERM sorting domain-containing protein [Kiritimatiellota bacterium B12222]